ncbi:E3 ubiquitin-protein ligase RSL1-like isoform X1 [Typha angustifolia]|uniref:E3 ubiquitin-protein ligase RSL1-like isoform X1 n=1 Tax=Typha angustifolia TaxID=59011 RepID=UPI003C2CED75
MEGSLYAQQVDDFYFSALSNGDEELFPISDEKYAEELQLQEVLMSATVASRFCSQALPPPRPPLVQKVRLTGVCSSSARTFCKICMETAVISEMFHSSNCSHAFCRNCLGRYIAAMINGNIPTVRCPEIGCKGVLEPELCREIVPKEVFERWVDASCESMVLASHKYYCPFKDCSAMMVNTREEAVTQSECPSCRRLFCARCNVPWHSGLSCNEFRGLGNDEKGREDLMLMEVAKSKAWKRCPRCKFFVEKTEGCMHITCRCGFEFCYGCGLKWSITHACCVNQR